MEDISNKNRRKVIYASILKEVCTEDEMLWMAWMVKERPMSGELSLKIPHEDHLKIPEMDVPGYTRDNGEYEMFEDLAESLESSGDFRTVNGDKKIEILMALAQELTLEEVEALARPYQHKKALAGIIL